MSVMPLVSTEWLTEHLYDDDIRILDGSWHLPGSARNATAEYAQAHIPGAGFFDIDVIAETMTALPHMLPRPEVFAAAVQTLGIGNEHFIVVYDTHGVYSSPRVWWMFRAMGHENCAVLDGGLPKWRETGGAVTTTPPRHKPGKFVPHPRSGVRRNYADMIANLDTRREQILDARSPARFAGLESEPRAGVATGHIPGSVNTHYADVLDQDGTFRPADELQRYFGQRNVDLHRPIVTTCGSGITAAIIALAAQIAGAKDVALYDGSWAEWGAKPRSPIVSASRQVQ